MNTQIVTVAPNTRIIRLFIHPQTKFETGVGVTGLVYNTEGLTAYYMRYRDTSPIQIPLVNTTVGNWTTGGFIEIDDTNLPGWYELQLPEACCVRAFRECIVTVFGAADSAQSSIRLLEERRRFISAAAN